MSHQNLCDFVIAARTEHLPAITPACPGRCMGFCYNRRSPLPAHHNPISDTTTTILCSLSLSRVCYPRFSELSKHYNCTWLRLSSACASCLDHCPCFLPQTPLLVSTIVLLKARVILFADHNATATAQGHRRTHHRKTLPRPWRRSTSPHPRGCLWSLQRDHCPIVAVHGPVLHPGKCPRRLSDRIPAPCIFAGIHSAFLALALLETKRASVVSNFRTWVWMIQGYGGIHLIHFSEYTHCVLVRIWWDE